MQKVCATILTGLMLGIMGCVTMPKPAELATADFGQFPTNYQQIVQNFMTDRLKDPDSATYRFEKPRKGFAQDGWAVGGKKHFGYVVVALINAKNSYGGYTGQQAYYFLLQGQGEGANWKGTISDITDSFTGPSTMAMFVEDAGKSEPEPVSAANSPTPPSQPSAAARPKVNVPGLVKEFEGTGLTTTRPFDVPNKWEIQWDSRGDIFGVFLEDVDGKLLGVAANQSGPGAGSAYQPKGGSYMLKVNATGPWTIRIVKTDK